MKKMVKQETNRNNFYYEGSLTNQLRDIVENTIKENNWDKLSSKQYEEFLSVKDIAKEIQYQGKSVKAEEVNDILEEVGICKREKDRIILTDEGLKYGRYVIAVHWSTRNKILSDNGYAKYKIDIKPIIEKFIAENPNFIAEKREERNKKRNETRQKNKELKAQQEKQEE